MHAGVRASRTGKGGRQRRRPFLHALAKLKEAGSVHIAASLADDSAKQGLCADGAQHFPDPDGARRRELDPHFDDGLLGCRLITGTDNEPVTYIRL